MTQEKGQLDMRERFATFGKERDAWVNGLEVLYSPGQFESY